MSSHNHLIAMTQPTLKSATNSIYYAIYSKLGLTYALFVQETKQCSHLAGPVLRVFTSRSLHDAVGQGEWPSQGSYQLTR